MSIAQEKEMEPLLGFPHGAWTRQTSEQLAIHSE